MATSKKEKQIKEVEYVNVETGTPTNVYDTLNRKISAYKSRYSIKIGITGRNPQQRFNEHLDNTDWERMVVIYRTTSLNYANTLEDWLIEKHKDDLVNKRKGGGSDLAEGGYNYVYLLLA